MGPSCVSGMALNTGYSAWPERRPVPSGSRQSHNIHANTLKRACKILVSEGEGCSDTNVCVWGGVTPHQAVRKGPSDKVGSGLSLEA